MENLPFRDVLDAVPIATIVVNFQRRIEVMNAAARALFGEAASGEDFVQAVRHPDCLTLLERALKKRRAGETMLTLQRPVRASFRVRATPVEGGAVLSFEDMTERAAAEAMRSEFVANISHELRTPLTSVLGFIETLKTVPAEDAEARSRFLEIMEAEATRMHRLIGDLLSLSRVEAEERVRPNAPVNVADILRHVVATLAPMAERTGSELALEIAPDIADPRVQGDEDQLEQVFLNLAENALKYGGGAPVAITLAPADRTPGVTHPALAVEVRDRGPGMAPEHLPRLTERFYRIDAGRSRARGGTGLGLAIVKHIVSRHRGRLLIESAPGEGSRFRVVLPQG